jgi:hypothetical protein
MGLPTSHLRFIEASIEQVFGKDVRGLHMLELGNQLIRDPNNPEKTGKDYFTNRGFQHVSVEDINGRNGALVRDLRKPDQFHEWHDWCDVLTNSGTTEHVEPFETQYDCFSILHDCLKVGGMAVHLVPDVYEHDERNAWKNHCRFYYSDAFFKFLAQECEYELLTCTVINGLRGVAVRKTKDLPFLKDRAKLLELIAQRDRQPHRSKNFVSAAWRKMGVGKLLRRIGL